jgi:type II secretory pathway pseudopilin PulG
MWWIIIELIIAVVIVIVAIVLFIIKIRKALAQSAQPSITYFYSNYCPNCGSPVNSEDVNLSN